MKAVLFALFAVLLVSVSYAYQIEQSREQMLSKYYSQVDAKVPKSMRMLLGDERINFYIGQSAIGIETRQGELRTFEYKPLSSPTIVIVVSDLAAESIENRSMGILEAMGNGGIRVKTSNWFSSFKVEALKQAYAVSGIDKRLTDKSIEEEDIYSANSLFMTRQRISVWN